MNSPFKSLNIFITCLLLLTISSLANPTPSLNKNSHYATAKKVFDDLVEAKGVKNMMVPKFELVYTEQKVAFVRPENAIIALEMKAFRICQSFGKDSLNALAAILGHELTHYYEKHSWNEDFASNHQNNSKHDLINHKMDEWQADYLGGFLARSAGYNTYGIMSSFLDRIYKAYHFNPALPGYPTLDERKKTALESEIKCAQLFEVQTMANYMIALGEFEMATTHLKFILKEFQSRSIYNNLGIVSLSEALRISADKNTDLAYPFELDFESRLNNSARGGESDFSKLTERKSALIAQGIEYFKTATVLDDAYAPAYLNLASAHLLNKEMEDASYFLGKAKKLAKLSNNNKLISDIIVMEALIEYEKGNLELTIDLLDKSISAGNHLASVNKDFISGKTSKKSTISLSKQKKAKETIDGISLDKFVNDLEREKITPDYTFEITKKIVFASLKKDHSVILIHLNPYQGTYLILQLTQQNYQGRTALDIQLGSLLQEVEQFYGECESSLQSTQGSILTYDYQQLIFHLNTEKKVDTWAVYRKK